MGEIWKPVKGYKNLYEVSNLGRVRSFIKQSYGVSYKRKKPKLLKPWAGGYGYPKVNLCKNKKVKTISVHTLVLVSFKGQRPYKTECCHIDGNPKNCKLTNLRWGTKKSNSSDRVKHGTDNRGTKNHSSKLTKRKVLSIKKGLKEEVSVRQLSEKYKVTYQCVHAIKQNKTWQHV